MGRKDKLKLARQAIYEKVKDDSTVLSKDELKAELRFEKDCKDSYDTESACIIQENLLKYTNEHVGNTMCEYLYTSNIEQFINYLHTLSN